MALLESVSNDIAQGHTDRLEENLSRLAKYGSQLADHAEGRARELEKLEQKCKEKLEEIQRKLKRLGITEEEVEGDMSLLTATMSSSDYFTPLAAKLYYDIRYLKRQRMKYHYEAGRMKEIGLFFRKASQFWKEFKEISKHGSGRTTLVQKIVKKAREKLEIQPDYLEKGLSSGGTKSIGKSFFEAWKEIETKYNEGVFNIDMEESCRSAIDNIAS